MNIIKHRVNTIEELKNVNHEYGIEVDVRYHNNEIILHHDPFNHHNSNPEILEDLIKEFKINHKGIIILNIKTEGIEMECIKLMNKYKIKSWFFLDLSMPYFCLYANKAYKREIEGFSPENFAVRFSEYEPIEYALAFKDKASWVWVDCFTKMPLNEKSYKQLKDANFKICLVAPELQKHSIQKTFLFQEVLKQDDIKIDAVCTKNANLWINL